VKGKLQLLPCDDGVRDPSLVSFRQELYAVCRARDGARLRALLAPDVAHGFDGDELPPAMRYPAGTLGHHPESAAAAWAEVERFLRP
jgi:dienelactone hydrolase